MKPVASKKPEDNTLVYFYPTLQVRDLVFWLLSFCLSYLSHPECGGAKRDRTADLLRARQALSQLSYSPQPLASGIT